MNDLIEKLKSEPVRVRMYAVLTLIVGYLLAKGVVGSDDAAFIGAVAAIVLGVAGVESARAQVSPVADEAEYEPEHRA